MIRSSTRDATAWNPPPAAVPRRRRWVGVAAAVLALLLVVLTLALATDPVGAAGSCGGG